MMLAFSIGVILAAGVALFAGRIGLDRDRAFYPTVMIVIAFLYVLFAAMSGSIVTVLLEMVPAIAFATTAVAGFRWAMSLVAIALVAHGVFDAFHAQLITNTAVPPWWPAFCSAYDVVAGGYLAFRLNMYVSGDDGIQGKLARAAFEDAGMGRWQSSENRR